MTFKEDKRLNIFSEKVDRFEKVDISSLPEGGINKIEFLKNEPKVVFSKWNGEVQLGMKYAKIQAVGARSLNNRIEYKDIKEEMHAYPLEKGEGMEDGGFEIEIVLKDKPDTNTFDFTIDGAEQLDFSYQPFLANLDLDGSTWGDNGRGGIARRLANVNGSYAVYHKTKASHQIGSINYATGKAFHIYRPKAFDANGKEEWAELSYVNGMLSVTVPQSFLDSAAYPVRVDPTFGNTSIGGTSSGAYIGANEFVALVATSPSDAGGAVLDSISYYGYHSSSGNLKAVITNSSGTILTNGVGGIVAVNTTHQWRTATYTTKPTLAASTGYWLGGVATAVETQFYYDATGTQNQPYDDSNNYTTPTNPTDATIY